MQGANIVVTGASGFLGRRLIAALLRPGMLVRVNSKHVPVDRIRAFDRVASSFNDPRVEVVVGDLNDAQILAHLINSTTDSVFHLAAVVSSQAEADFDLGYAVNFDATRGILEQIRKAGNAGLRFITTSSLAVYGGKLPAVVTDDTASTPQSSYGTAKAMSDLLVSDYGRRGYVDGLVLRLPTVVIRPGRPNLAASSFASGIIREPLNGEDAVCPVEPTTVLWITSPDAAVINLLHGLDLPTDCLTNGRVVNVPGLSVSVHEMLASLEAIAGMEAAGRIMMKPDVAVQRIVNSWPGNIDTQHASSLGFIAPTDFRTIIMQYMEEHLPVRQMP